MTRCLNRSDGEQGEKIQEGIDVLSSAVDNLQAAIDDLENLN
jgi:outer membrane murein-binding lipoprotein Lpp